MALSRARTIQTEEQNPRVQVRSTLGSSSSNGERTIGAVGGAKGSNLEDELE